MTRIVIADDHEIVRKQLRIVLQNADASFVVCGEAADGREAVLKTNELKPDVVILDLAMPVMDGLAAAREISKAAHKVVMFIYTLHTCHELEIEAASAGIRGIVAKPLTRELLPLLREVAHSNASRPKCEG